MITIPLFIAAFCVGYGLGTVLREFLQQPEHPTPISVEQLCKLGQAWEIFASSSVSDHDEETVHAWLKERIEEARDGK